MSNLAIRSIKLPKNITVRLKKNLLFIEGPLGTKTLRLLVRVALEPIKNQLYTTNISFSKLSTENKLESKALQGSTHAIIIQTILDLCVGFHKTVDVVGVGYRIAVKEEERILSLKVGLSHVIHVNIPPGFRINCAKHTRIFIIGNSKEDVNQMAALIRSFKIPESYKGKGLVYEDEEINKKEGKRS